MRYYFDVEIVNLLIQWCIYFSQLIRFGRVWLQQWFRSYLNKAIFFKASCSIFLILSQTLSVDSLIQCPIEKLFKQGWASILWPSMLYHWKAFCSKIQLQLWQVPEKMLNNWYIFKFCKIQIQTFYSVIILLWSFFQMSNGLKPQQLPVFWN